MPDFKCKRYKEGCEGVIWPPRQSTQLPSVQPTMPIRTLPMPTKPFNSNGKSEEEQKNISRQVSLYAAVDFIGHLTPVDMERELMRLAQKFYEWLTPSAQRPAPVSRPSIQSSPSLLPSSPSLPPLVTSFSHVADVMPSSPNYEPETDQGNYENSPF